MKPNAAARWKASTWGDLRFQPKRKPRLGRPFGSVNAGSIAGQVKALAGKSFHLKPGTRAIYPGLTDMKAYLAGYAAGLRRQRLSSNPYTDKKRAESFIDGWAEAAATLIPLTVPQ